MTEEIRLKLLEWAREYHCVAFIQGDPVQLLYRYMRKQDIGISGLLTALMNFGNRKQVLRKADELHDLVGTSPHQYVLSCRWKEDFLSVDRSSFYRILSHVDFCTYFARLHDAYSRFDSLKDTPSSCPGIPTEKLYTFLEVSAKNPQKKLNMFLRWIIQKESEVDFDIWESFDRHDLLIPLDTHVCRVARLLGLTDTETFPLESVRNITSALAEVFPGDPCLGDFTSFGCGVNGML